MCLPSGRKCPSTISESFKHNKLSCLPLQVSDKCLMPPLPLLPPKTLLAAKSAPFPQAAAVTWISEYTTTPSNPTLRVFQILPRTSAGTRARHKQAAEVECYFPFGCYLPNLLTAIAIRQNSATPWVRGGVSSKMKSVNYMFICAALDPRSPFNLLEVPLWASFYPLPDVSAYLSSVMPFPCWLMDPLLRRYKATWSTTVAYRETVNLVIKKIYLLIKVFPIWNICPSSSF